MPLLLWVGLGGLGLGAVGGFTLGGGAIVGGLGMIFQSPAADQVAQAIPQVAGQIVSHNLLGALMTIFGLLAVVRKEGQ